MNERISAVSNGKEITGYRTIAGKRKLMQAVTYNGITELDSLEYKVGERDGAMLTIAQMMLLQIASGRTMK